MCNFTVLVRKIKKQKKRFEAAFYNDAGPVSTLGFTRASLSEPTTNHRIEYH